MSIISEQVKRLRAIAEKTREAWKHGVDAEHIALEKSANALDEAANTIEMLSANKSEKATGWISVEDRLPEIGKRVLVTAYGKVCYAQMISTSENCGYPIFLIADSLKEDVHGETISHSESTKTRISAWRELPEVYKAD